MHQLSNLLKNNVKINFTVNIVVMTELNLHNKFLHNNIRTRHASNLLQYGCIIKNKNQ